MTNYAKLDHKNGRIVMDRTFAKNADIIGSEEYKTLQKCRKNYPTYQVVRREIKKKEGQNHYEGLTIEAMREYIKRHEAAEHIDLMLEKFEMVIADMECISKHHSYPRVKSWFIKNYPEVKDTGKLFERPQSEGSNELVLVEPAA